MIVFKKVSNTALKIQRKLDSGKTASIPREYADSMEIKESDGKPYVFVNEKKSRKKGIARDSTALHHHSH